MLKVTYDYITKTLDRVMPHIIFAVSPENIDECGTKLNLLRDGVLELGGLAQEALFYEYYLFHTIVRGKPFITNIIEDLKPRLTDEEQIIASDYGNARFAVLQVEEIVTDDAVTVFDWVQEKPRLLLIDKDAHHLKVDDLLVCHLMDLNDF